MDRRGSIVWTFAIAILALFAPTAPTVTPGNAAPPDTFAARFVVEHVREGGVDRAYAVWLPSGWNARRAWPGIVFLHGAGECGADAITPTRIGIGPALTEYPERWPC